MNVIVDIVLLAVFLGILVKSASFSVDAIVKFSKIMGFGEMAVGFIIVAVATSSPEIAITFFSLSTNNVGIALGDIFGSNVTNIFLITALLLLVSPIKQLEKVKVKKLFPVFFAGSVIPLLLLVSKEGNKITGILLLVIFSYFVYSMFKSRRIQKTEQKETGSAHKQLLYFIIGIIIVIISSKFVVDSSSSIAGAVGIRESVIGATIIAFGTSLPELAVDLAAVRKRHLDLALGDIIGSCLTNITLILGLMLVITDIKVNFEILSSLIIFAIIAPVSLYIYLRTGTISFMKSISLFLMYIVFIIVIYEIQIEIGGIAFPLFIR